MKTLAAAILVLLCLSCPAFAEGPAPSSQDGPARVAGVSFYYPGELPESLPGLVAIKAGDEYSAKAVRQSIKLIYLMGIFRDIVVEGNDTPAGLALTFHLVPKMRVEDISVEGDDELSANKVVGAMTVKEGDYLDEKMITKSIEGIRRLMLNEGLRDGRVEITKVNEGLVSTDLLVTLFEGSPAIVRDIRFEGDMPLDEEDMAGELLFGVGDVLKKQELDDSVDSVTRLYVDENYVNVSVDVSDTWYETGSAHVAFKVEAGPRLEVEFDGNEEISDSSLRSRLTFWEDKDVSPESVTENLERLAELYREEGYYYAAVTASTEQSGPPQVISVRFIVVEGPRASLEGIDISGNKELEEDEILSVMELSESSVFSSTRVTDGVIKDDLKRIKALYESRGYLNAEVGPADLKFSDDGSEAFLEVGIIEGPRTIITGIVLEGNKAVPAEELLSLVTPGCGSPLNPQLLNEYRNGMLNLYSQRGYIHATIDVRKDFSEDATGVMVVFSISEGIPVSIGRIILRGNLDVKDTVIMRELLFKPGGAYDYEKILRSQQRIFRLGYMSQVKIQPVNPDKVERVKDLLVSVRERDAGTVGFGGGYGEYDRFRGFGEVSYGNLFGYGHRISARGELSTKETKTVLSYKWPWFGGWPMDFRSSLVYLDADKPNYHIEDVIASTGFDKTFGEHVTASLFYQYEELKLDAPAGAVLAPEDRKKSNLASVSPSVVLDLRDNPFNPTTGSVHAVILKWASGAFGSTVDFVKLTAQTSWYFPVYKGVIFGVSARGGMEGWVSDKVEVPINERFFLGGASSLRGYEFESVSPKSPDGTNIGGDRMVLFNAELRFPLPYGFGAVGFLDAGNAWLDNKDATYSKLWKDKYGDDTKVRSVGGLRYGAGVGIRYDTPVGPLRLDYGFKLNPQLGDDSGELHFTLGQAF